MSACTLERKYSQHSGFVIRCSRSLGTLALWVNKTVWLYLPVGVPVDDLMTSSLLMVLGKWLQKLYTMHLHRELYVYRHVHNMSTVMLWCMSL